MKYVLYLLTILSSNLLAADYGPWTKVEKIYQQTKNETPFVNFGVDSMPGCHGNNGGYLNKLDEKGSERTFSILLTALTASREVRVYYELNDVPSGYVGWGLCDIVAIHIR